VEHWHRPTDRLVGHSPVMAAAGACGTIASFGRSRYLVIRPARHPACAAHLRRKRLRRQHAGALAGKHVEVIVLLIVPTPLGPGAEGRRPNHPGVHFSPSLTTCPLCTATALPSCVSVCWPRQSASASLPWSISSRTFNLAGRSGLGRPAIAALSHPDCLWTAFAGSGSAGSGPNVSEGRGFRADLRSAFRSRSEKPRRWQRRLRAGKQPGFHAIAGPVTSMRGDHAVPPRFRRLTVWPVQVTAPTHPLSLGFILLAWLRFDPPPGLSFVAARTTMSPGGAIDTLFVRSGICLRNSVRGQSAGDIIATPWPLALL